MSRPRLLAAAGALAALLAPGAPALAAPPAPLASTSFTAPRAGEARLALTATSPDTDWGTRGRTAPALSVRVDGRRTQDVVLFGGREPLAYRVLLGRVSAGRHAVEVALDDPVTPPGARAARVQVTGLRPSLAPANDLVARHAPILYGRNLPEIPGAYENAYTDVPLLAYHTTSRDAEGHRVLEYAMIWSNEDGGTNTPALMARWGRTTDIEWIYRVTLGAGGRALHAEYQAPNHETLTFTGAKEGEHALLQTATANNNLVQVDDPARSSHYRFFLDPRQALPPNRAREEEMDRNPWTYRVTALEMLREGRLEAVANPTTPAVSDQRNYLFAELDKVTTYPTPPAPGSWVGLALEVKRKGDPTWYASHHGVPDWSIQRDIPAATTVELPPGTRAADVEAVKAVAVPVAAAGTPPQPAPTDYAVRLTRLNRGFFLGADYEPEPSFLFWRGSVTLTPAHPEAVIWRAGQP